MGSTEMAKCKLPTLFLAIFLSCLGQFAYANKRVALVIGNTDYENVAKLENPGNDASDIAQVLKTIGFEVALHQNLSFSTMRRVVRGFQKQARDADVSLVYYAGHGIEVDKRNYLIPSDAILENILDVPFEAMSLDHLVLSASGARQLSLVIVDACRNNPFATNMKRVGNTRSVGSGLADVEAAGNTLIAYAAKGGTVASDGVGRNSPYAEALKKALSEPKIEVGFMFRKVRDHVLELTDNQQEPFVYGSLSANQIFLNETEPEMVQTATLSIEPPKQNDNIEVISLIWETIRDSKDIADFEDFIESYPDSPFAPYARRAKRRLLNVSASTFGVQTTITIPNAEVSVAGTGSNATSRAANEHKLNLNTMLPKPPKAEQSTTALPMTDVTIPRQWISNLEPDLQTVAPANLPEAKLDTKAGLAIPKALADPATAQLTAKASQGFVLASIAPDQAAPVIGTFKPTRKEILDVQERLSTLGFKLGRPDGIAGPKTEAAIRAYQSSNNLLVDGVVNQTLISRLRGDVSEDELKVYRASLKPKTPTLKKTSRKSKAKRQAKKVSKQTKKPVQAKPSPAPQKKRIPRWKQEHEGGEGGGEGGGGGGL